MGFWGSVQWGKGWDPYLSFSSGDRPTPKRQGKYGLGRGECPIFRPAYTEKEPIGKKYQNLKGETFIIGSDKRE